MKIVAIDDAGEPQLAPDLLWDGRAGDLAVTAIDDPANPSGLRAEQHIATAVLICLMTDRRVDPGELPDGEANRGWPGDSFDMEPGDVPLGSKLWLLRRRALTADTALAAEDHAREALQTLIDQGAFVRFDVTAAARPDANRIDIDIAGYGRSGERTFDRRFAILWDQLHGVSKPLAR